jgi:thiamine biosynthesis protein ThiI
MEPPGADVVLVRHGEIGTKSEQVRGKMERQLRNNLDSLLTDRGIDGHVEQRRLRLLIHSDEPMAACDAATDAFGVVSASPTRRVEPTQDAVETALADCVRAHYDGGSFAVEARRAGETDAHPFSSHDIEREGGSAAWEAAETEGYEPRVDLDDPEFELFVDCRPHDAYVFLEKRDGPGGLPLGTQEPLVAMVSGGIDSPVAAWEAMKRGSPVVPLYVGLGDYGGVDNQARAVAAVDRLAEHAPNRDLRLRFAPAGDVVDDLDESVDSGRMLVLRRFMFAVAERVAREAGAVGIVTGESVGQKSSQTTANLAVTDAATDLPVHRPLLTRDKTDITEQADAIGTFADSTIPAGCDRIAPEYPETNASLDAIRAVEPDDLFERAEAVAERIEVLDPAG